MGSERARRVIIAPSILSADFGRLRDDIASVEKAGCEWLHIDVMDGHFVPNITIGPVVVAGVKRYTSLTLDVHLMIENPEKYIVQFADAGADWITVHYEACDNCVELYRMIKAAGCKAGISVKPGTVLTHEVIKVVAQFDLVLIMTVEPGFGGQSFMADMVGKIATLRPVYKGLLSVDGGINDKTARSVREAGADVIVAGSYVFGHSNRAQAIQSLR